MKLQEWRSPNCRSYMAYMNPPRWKHSWEGYRSKMGSFLYGWGAGTWNSYTFSMFWKAALTIHLTKSSHEDPFSKDMCIYNIIYIYVYTYYVYHISKKNNGCGLHVHLFSTAIFLSDIRLLWDSPQVKHCVHVAWLWQGSCGPSWRCHPLNTQGGTRRTTQGCPDSRSVWIWGI